MAAGAWVGSGVGVDKVVAVTEGIISDRCVGVEEAPAGVQAAKKVKRIMVNVANFRVIDI